MLSFTACEKDGTKVELDMTDAPVEQKGNFYQTGYNKGAVFAKGLLAMKDTIDAVNRSYSAVLIELDNFQGKIVAPISICEHPFLSFREAQKSTNGEEWKNGFYQATLETASLEDTTEVSQIIELYSHINKADVKAVENVDYVIKIGRVFGCYAPKINGY